MIPLTEGSLDVSITNINFVIISLYRVLRLHFINIDNI